MSIKNISPNHLYKTAFYSANARHRFMRQEGLRRGRKANHPTPQYMSSRGVLRPGGGADGKFILQLYKAEVKSETGTIITVVGECKKVDRERERMCKWVCHLLHQPTPSHPWVSRRWGPISTALTRRAGQRVQPTRCNKFHSTANLFPTPQ